MFKSSESQTDDLPFETVMIVSEIDEGSSFKEPHLKKACKSWFLKMLKEMTKRLLLRCMTFLVKEEAKSACLKTSNEGLSQ